MVDRSINIAQYMDVESSVGILMSTSSPGFVLLWLGYGMERCRVLQVYRYRSLWYIWFQRSRRYQSLGRSKTSLDCQNFDAYTNTSLVLWSASRWRTASVIMELRCTSPGSHFCITPDDVKSCMRVTCSIWPSPRQLSTRNGPVLWGLDFSWHYAELIH